jgi:hypothetical protein
MAKPKVQTKEEITTEMTEKLNQLKAMDETRELVRDNVNEFSYKNKLYRVHRPLSWEKDEIKNQRTIKYTEFLENPNYRFKKQLVILLAEKGVDVLAMERDAQKLFNEEKNLLKRLAQTTTEPDITTIKKDIEDVRVLQEENFVEREGLLQYCIEKQLEDHCRFYLLYLVLEVKNSDAWEKVYKTYQDFQNADDDIMLGRAAQILAYLIYNESI